MNVVGLISSANHDGNSATLVREALRGAAAEGATTTEIFLPEWRIEFCLGCLRCMAEGKCHQADEFERLRSTLYQADGIILGSPTFGAAPNARMKNVFDRLGMFEYFTSSLGDKYVAAISTASSPGTARKVAKSLARLVTGGVFQRGYISGVIGAKARGQGLPVDADAMAKAGQLGRQLAVDFRQRKSYPWQNLAKRLVGGLVMKPMFTKAIVAHKEGMMKGVYRNLKERGLIS